jgi:hypothetical protein
LLKNGSVKEIPAAMNAHATVELLDDVIFARAVSHQRLYVISSSWGCLLNIICETFEGLEKVLLNLIYFGAAVNFMSYIPLKGGCNLRKDLSDSLLEDINL